MTSRRCVVHRSQIGLWGPRRGLLLLAVLLAWRPATGQTLPAGSQESQPASEPAPGTKLLTPEILWGPEGRVDFNGTRLAEITWLPDGVHYLQRRDGRLMRVHAESDAAEPAYSRDALERALRAQGDFDDKDVARFVDQPGQFSKDRWVALLTHEKRLYLYRFDTATLTRLCDPQIERPELTLSPLAGYVGFVSDNDLYVLNTKTRRLRRLTRDGCERRLNGILDWVYQEEVYGRGNYRGYWWREDDAYIAMLTLDETGVPMFPIVDKIPQHGTLETMLYPKAGDTNPTAQLSIIRPDNGKRRIVDLSRYQGGECLIVRVGWAPDGKLIFQVQDREQTWLDLNEADPQTGRCRTMLHETSPAWVNVLLDEPHWLPDGSFLWLSERDGWRHVYHYARDGRLIRRLTAGEWEVRDVHGVDAAGEWLYVSGTRDSLIENHLYRVRLDGTGEPQRLTEPGYSHSANVDPTGRRFVDSFSNIDTPPRAYLRSTDGSLLRVLSDKPVEAIAEFKLGRWEFLRYPARDGYMLTGLLLRPPDFDPSRKYPVLVDVYAGPDSQTVRNRWTGNGGMADQMLAQQGYMVWSLDPRSASGAGATSAWQCYERLGESELSDIEDSVRFLIEQHGADPARIGINGYSYGGFMTCYAMTHSELFKMGVAGGSVTDWHNYDTIYTERYMRTPANNPEGYERSSVVKAAAKLHGRLLLIHGMLDDNVHFQNTVQLIERLQAAGKTFDVMIYPRDQHGIGHGMRHYQQLRLRYIQENL
jgi:dipeptidyl-peptidase-4